MEFFKRKKTLIVAIPKYIKTQVLDLAQCLDVIILYVIFCVRVLKLTDTITITSKNTLHVNQQNPI